MAYACPAKALLSFLPPTSTERQIAVTTSLGRRRRAPAVRHHGLLIGFRRSPVEVQMLVKRATVAI